MYIHIEWERDVCICIIIYICIYTWSERERERGVEKEREREVWRKREREREVERDRERSFKIIFQSFFVGKSWVPLWHSDRTRAGNCLTHVETPGSGIIPVVPSKHFCACWPSVVVSGISGVAWVTGGGSFGVVESLCKKWVHHGKLSKMICWYLLIWNLDLTSSCVVQIQHFLDDGFQTDQVQFRPMIYWSNKQLFPIRLIQ